MAKQLQLTIPIPCHEGWENMTPADKGRFCDSCQKQVVDFSSMSDRQLAEFFKKPSTGSVCGRFITDQLDRAIDIPRKRIPWVRYFFQVTLPAFLISMKASAQLTQGAVRVNTTKKIIPPASSLIFGEVEFFKPIAVTKAVLNDSSSEVIRAIKGIVTNEAGEPLPGASIVIKGLNTVVTTGTDGQFNRTLKIPLLTIDLRVSYIGYNILELTLAKERTDSLVLRLSPWTGGMVEGFVVCTQPPIKKEDNTRFGTVIDEKGQPLPGASVLIKSTRNSTTTNNKGEFQIRAKEGDKLVTSASGMETTETVVGKSDTIIIPVRYMVLGMVAFKPNRKKESRDVSLMKETFKDAASGTFKIFPNPVQGGSSIILKTEKLKKGNYTLWLLNPSGQSVLQQDILIDAGTTQLDIEIPGVAAGSYFLVLTNTKTGKKFTEKIIIQ